METLETLLEKQRITQTDEFRNQILSLLIIIPIKKKRIDPLTTK